MNSVQIKICGITNVSDANVCVSHGADMIGLNFYPGSSRYIEPQLAQKIVNAVRGRVVPIGVFVDATASEIRSIAKAVGLESVQLHGNVSPELCRKLASEFRVIRAFSTDRNFQPKNIRAFSDCDVLIDAPHPELRGGTGLTCDWSTARTTAGFASFLFLSGGLNAHNVGEAIAAVAPNAVDVCSGVECEPGKKDHRAIEQFISAARIAQRVT